MTSERILTDNELTELMQRARTTQALASIRAVGSIRLLGDLRVNGLEVGKALHLGGVRRRDQLLPPGTPVALSLVLGEDIWTLRSRLLNPILSPDGDTLVPPVLRLAWPSPDVEVHRRSQVRVGTPDLPPLPARLLHRGRSVEVELLNLTEVGVGVGSVEALDILPSDEIELETTLPGGHAFRAKGEVRHRQWLEGDRLPTRLGLVLRDMEETHRETLRRFVQARRTLRSEALRQGF